MPAKRYIVELTPDERQTLEELTKTGQPERFDYEYQRLGVSNLFMFFEPLTGWRHVEVTDQPTQIDYAQQMKYLVDERYPLQEV